MLKIALESCESVCTTVCTCRRSTTERVHEDLGTYKPKGQWNLLSASVLANDYVLKHGIRLGTKSVSKLLRDQETLARIS